VKRLTLIAACESLFGLLVVAACLASFRHVSRFVGLPYQLNYAEGVVLTGVERVVDGQSLYPPPQQFPVIITPYGPVYYYLCAWLLKWFGPAFAPLRLITIVSAVVIAGLLALLLHQLTASWRLGLGFAFLFLSLPVVRDWLPLARVDVPGIALSLAGLYLYARFRDQWYVSIPFFLAAFFCKYTMLAAPGTCFLDLLFRKQKKRAAWFAGSLVLLSALVFLGLERTTQGGYIFHTITSHADPFTPGRALMFIRHALREHIVLVILAFGLVPFHLGLASLSIWAPLWASATRRLANPRLRDQVGPAPRLGDLRKEGAALSSLYLAFSALSLITAGKQGSDSNYLLEWLAVLCLSGGLSYSTLRQQSEKAAAAFAVAGVLTLCYWAVFRPPSPYPRYAGCPEAYAFVKRHPGQRIISEDVGAVVMAGKPVQISDPFAWSWLVRREGWSEAELENLVRARAFEVIILNASISWQKESREISRWPLPFLDALQQNYRPTWGFACQDAGIAYEPFEAAPH